MKRFAAFLTLLATLLFALPATQTQASGASPVGQVYIPSLNISRNIYQTAPSAVQNMLDACIGAVSLDLMPGMTWLGAHRTHCGSRGFGGVETLTNGATVVVTLNGRTRHYSMIGGGIGIVGTVADPPPFGTDLVLQTSRSSHDVYLRFFEEIDGVRAPQGRGHMMTNGSNVCVDSGGSQGEFALVNLTPTDSAGGGYGTLYPAGGSPGNTSSVNWNGSFPEPNTALTEIGQNGQICVGTMGAATNMVVDVIAIAPAGSFQWQAQRLLDTREDGGPIADSRRCIDVPGTPGDWAIINLTPIGITYGFGLLEAPNQHLDISNVNYLPGVPNPNMTFVQIPASGQLCYRSVGAAHVVIDLQATAPQSAIWGSPMRLVDTRLDINGAQPHHCMSISIGSSPVWMLVNLTSDHSTGAGFGRIYSSEKYPDMSSDVNYTHAPDPNVSMVKLTPGNNVCVTSMGAPAEWIVDGLAYAKDDLFRVPQRRRVLDTRLG